MKRWNQWNIESHPEMIRLCLTCAQSECPGLCVTFRRRKGELLALLADGSVRTGPNGQTGCEVNGVWHTYNEWSRISGLSSKRIRDRVQRLGWPPDKAINVGINSARGRKYRAFGEIKTLSAWCAQFHRGHSTVQQRLAEGWSLEDALRIDPRDVRDQTIMEWRGRRYTLKELARIKGVDYYVLYNRIVKSGWTVERAMAAPLRACVKTGGAGG